MLMCVIELMLRRHWVPVTLSSRGAGATRTALAYLLLVGVATHSLVGPLHAQATDSTRITRAEITAHPRVPDALALIKQLRPGFLAGRSEPVVYIDTTRAFSIDDLSTVPTLNVQEIQFLTGAQAAARSGPDGAAAVVILVRTRRQAIPPRNTASVTNTTAVSRKP